jgi:two-component system phosphate regulon sensor histidine kinase PhoR
MEVGLIPLNFSAEELLPLIQKWVDENTFKNTERLSHINELERNINQQLRFTKEYGNELSRLMREGGLENHSTIGNNFKVVNIFSGNNLKLILINPSLKNPAGFLIDREKLLAPIVESNLQADFEFEYKIEFPNGYNTSSNGQQLTFSSQLNPYFSGQMMLISLSDENLIKDIIRRRSWIYGIATVLLLVAMFLGVALIIRDSAREKHVARMRSDFISNVTHELKTPLTSIYMFAESLLLGRIKSADGKKEYLTIILKESERLKRMINNILEFSKMEDGKPEYHFEHSNLASLLNATISDMNYWFEEENFDIVRELDENISADVDPEKMQQLISNLLNNAFKYSGETKSIIIRLFQKANQIYLEIEDEGIGIAEDQLTKIFEKFYRIDQKESISGTGLGLTVVKEIIEAHHGKIFVTSKMGKGSKFSIILNQQISKG